MRPARALALLAGAALTAALAVTYGIYAGRHDAFPAPLIVHAKAVAEDWLDLERRWRRPVFADTGAHIAAPCPRDPIVILTGGQSNAANAVSDPVDADPTVPAFMHFAGRCYRLADPLLGASGGGGSLWAALGQDVARAGGRPVVLINTALTATSYAAWLDGGSGYFAGLEARLAEAAEAGMKPHLILWHQGESDAHLLLDEAAFAAPLGALAERLLGLALAPGAKLVLYQVSVCSGARSAGNAPLLAAQRRVAAGDPRILAGPNTDRLGPRARYDGCHFNGRGRDLAVAWSRPIVLTALGLPLPPR